MKIDKEISSDHSTSGKLTASGDPEEQRDEVQEIRKISARDTRRIHFWRLVVTSVLLITAVVITFITYSILNDDERSNFEVAFDQFSRTVADAAIQQQKDIRNVYNSFANTLTAHVQSSDDVAWPFVQLPLFQSYADEVLEQSRTEIFHLDIFVTREQKQEYLSWATNNYQAWINEGHSLANSNATLDPSEYHPYFTYVENGNFYEDTEDRDVFLSAWQFAPPPNTYKMVNWNIYSTDDGIAIIDALLSLRNETLFSEVRKYRVSSLAAFTPEQHEAMHSSLPGSTEEHPHSFVRVPVRESVNDPNAPVVAVISAALAWDAPMQNLLPESVVGLMAVIDNDCDQAFSWEINGREALFIGKGDLHDSKYTSMERVANLAIHSHPEYANTPGHCQYKMRIYPTARFEAMYNSNTDKAFAALVALTFVAIAIVFFVYDIFVQRRNEKLIANAARSNEIVSSMFPSNIRDRLINNQKNNSGFKSLVSGDVINQTYDESKPLADLFLETTVMLADIAGFTAWSSVREPTQVFILLETLYQSFDQIAKSRRVFKVETVGDCYVAVTGIPKPRKDHAVAMVRFAKDVIRKMHITVNELSSSLGPDTADLNLRIGLSSGQVTAGVVRGEKARFQLFGDTMDTAAKLEATGQPGRIHVAQSTAEILINMDKGHWMEKREGVVVAKGREIQTWWIKNHFDRKDLDRKDRESENSVSNSAPADFYADVSDSSYRDEHLNRLVEWNYQTLLQLIKLMIAHRNAKGKRIMNNYAKEIRSSLTTNGTYLLDEVQEIITLPEFDRTAADIKQVPDEVEVPQAVQKQLKSFVACVGTMYRNNPFHNFEHASHVTMSVMKLLSRIVAPSEYTDTKDKSEDEALALHDHTYGITSDPITQFACAFSALIHDVDHLGVPNATLVKENTSIAAVYKNRSVAEQNSLVLSWDLLNRDMFSDLRSVIYTNEEEYEHFRQLVVNMVLATDIVDKELKELRNGRWEKAFKDNAGEINNEDPRAVVNRKATIVIEHLIQASDVAHTMQHWHIYRKWNERFFIECYNAYKMGRAESNPADTWYKGEIGFFDFYIIPLARKLKDCGIFGKSSDEYLNYALMNRKEWETKGQAIVEAMVEEIEKEMALARYDSKEMGDLENEMEKSMSNL